MANTPRMKQGSRLTKAQFHALRVPEGSSGQQIDRHLEACLRGDLPGLIIRKETKREFDILDHEKFVEFVGNTLLRQGAEFEAGPTKTKTKPKGLGDLHTDGAEAVEKVLNFNVHTTSRGCGDIMLALPGHEAKGLIDAESQRKPGFGTLAVRSAWEKLLHNLAKSGQTFTELIYPEAVYVSRVDEGDSVVIALESQRGPMFHRFDTDSEDREALITELNRPE